MNQEDFISINNQKHSLLENKIKRIEIKILPKGIPIGITIKDANTTIYLTLYNQHKGQHSTKL